MIANLWKWIAGRPAKALMAAAGLAAVAVGVYSLPPVNSRLGWRLDAGWTYLRGIVYPADAAPTPIPTPTNEGPTATATVTASPTVTPTPTEGPTATPIPSPTPLPGSAALPAPAWEKQDWNNCGPATLTLYLRTFGWTGDQYDVSGLLKPKRDDRNVNVEELVYYVRTQAGWLNADFRVGGDIETLKRFLANGLPVMIEEGYILEETYWPNDDHWAGHYLLLTGYDDASQTFTVQDSFLGPDRSVPYETLKTGWKAFNRVFIYLYRPDQQPLVQEILGPHWDQDVNRQAALEQALAETAADPDDAYAWFNLGSNYVYFEQYFQAAQAYDTARSLGLPQRMLRYQFGPFIAYFHSFRLDDLMALANFALQRTPNSEETLLWRGWGYFRQGETAKALRDWEDALKANPNYADALYAINFANQN